MPHTVALNARSCTPPPVLPPQLISPCGCAGSAKYIHKRCLAAWQFALVSRGAYGKVLRCGVCNQPYDTTGLAAGMPTSLSSLVSTARSLAGGAWSMLSFKGAYNVWKSVVLASSLVQAARSGAAGLGTGAGLGLALLQPVLPWIARNLPSLALFSFLVPGLQLPTVIGLVALSFGVSLVVTVPCLLGLYAGSLYGFFSGSVAALKLTRQIALAVARGCGARLLSGGGAPRPGGLGGAAGGLPAKLARVATRTALDNL